METKQAISLEFFASGYCVSHKGIVNPKKGKGKGRFYAVWALLHIPGCGYVLFDTGYSNHFEQSTQKIPAIFYRWLTPMTLEPGASAAQQLEQRGINPHEIKFIVLSHFHADHIAGLKDFPFATFICTKLAYEQVMNVSGVKAVSKGILHALLPNNFQVRVLFLEEIADAIITNAFGMTEYTIWGQTKLKFVLLPGHVKGMLGFIYQSQSHHILYATDASWEYETYKDKIYPSKVAKLVFDSWSDFIATQNKILAYEEAHPDVRIIFTHCPLTLSLLQHVF